MDLLGMFKKILITIICVCSSLYAFADELQLKENSPKTYIVKKGDTLWDISGVFLNEPWLWPKLWRINPDINNPHLIYPGDELRLVFDANGQPMLVKGKPELKWSPNKRKSLKDANPITILPLEYLAPYLHNSLVLTKAKIKKLPIILGNDSAYKSSLDGAKLYVKGDLLAGKSYAVYSQGQALIDPETNEMLGYNMVLVGTGKATSAGDIKNKVPATIFLDSSKREVRSGNVVLAINEDQQLPAFYAMQEAKSNALSARILLSANDAREFGKFEIVLLNKGLNSNVGMGDIYAINREGANVIETKNGPMYDVDASKWDRLTSSEDNEQSFKMPTENVGHLMVFKVQEKTSYAIILATEKQILISDLVETP